MQPISGEMISLDIVYQHIKSDVEKLLAMPPVLLSDAKPPNSSGVYMFLCGEEVVYIGEAKGSGGLEDRILRKHLSGDEGHALQRGYKERFPDRLARREHLRTAVSVRWTLIENCNRISAVERVLIWIYQPKLNTK